MDQAGVFSRPLLGHELGPDDTGSPRSFDGPLNKRKPELRDLVPSESAVPRRDEGLGDHPA